MESSMYPRRPARTRHRGTRARAATRASASDTRLFIFGRTPFGEGHTLAIVAMPARGDHESPHLAIQIERTDYSRTRVSTVRCSVESIPVLLEALAWARDRRTGLVGTVPGITRDVRVGVDHDGAVTLALHDHAGVRCGRAIPVRPVMHATLERALEWLAGAQ